MYSSSLSLSQLVWKVEPCFHSFLVQKQGRRSQMYMLVDLIIYSSSLYLSWCGSRAMLSFILGIEAGQRSQMLVWSHRSHQVQQLSLAQLVWKQSHAFIHSWYRSRVEIIDVSVVTQISLGTVALSSLAGVEVEPCFHSFLVQKQGRDHRCQCGHIDLIRYSRVTLPVYQE